MTVSIFHKDAKAFTFFNEVESAEVCLNRKGQTQVVMYFGEDNPHITDNGERERVVFFPIDTANESVSIY